MIMYKKHSLEQFLFDRDKFLKRPDANQQKVNEAILPYLPIIHEAFEESFRTYHNMISPLPPSYFTPQYPATTLNGILWGKLREKLTGHRFIDTAEKRTFWILDDKYWVTIKKLNNDYKPSNIPTQNTRRILTQYAPKAESTCPILFLGYRISHGDWTEPEGIYVTYVDQEKDIHWVTDLSLLSSQPILSDYSVISGSSPIEIKQDRVQVKKRKLVMEV